MEIENILYEKEIVAAQGENAEKTGKISVTQEINCYLVWFAESAEGKVYLISCYPLLNGKNQAIERGVELGWQGWEKIMKDHVSSAVVLQDRKESEKITDAYNGHAPNNIENQSETGLGIIGSEEYAQKVEETQTPPVAPEEAIQEDYIVCLECGKSFRMLSKAHLALHNLSPLEYKQKWAYDKNTSLTCKSLLRLRREQMEDFNLWKKRKIDKKS